MTRVGYKRMAVLLYIVSFLLVMVAAVLPAFVGMAKLVLAMPLWILSVMFLAAGSYYLGASWEPKIGHCQNCDYNLTGNVSGICPECGSEVKR